MSWFWDYTSAQGLQRCPKIWGCSVKSAGRLRPGQWKRMGVTVSR